ncbi:MAG: 1,4-dihydroxy-2-naphthoate octaprenyltransferase [Bacteroidales bacterium]|nr:1,4-dihydroxy-2-naphthoate octaprenyltransferase [Candidatus Liminaster caballi]
MKQIFLWLRIIRPQTLPASLCPVLVALMMTSSGDIDGTRNLVAAITIVCALSLQILSNLINDYYDFRRGADTQGRKGFRRALAEGEVSERQMKAACLITLGVCVLCGLYLVTVGGLVILSIGVSAILFAWLYTATDYSLSYLGIADIFVFLYYGVIASSGTYYLIEHSFTWPVFFAGGVCGLISMCVLLINNLRDMDDDRRVGKRTLPVRFGRIAGLALMCAVVLLLPVSAYLAFGLSLPMAVIIPGICLFIAVCRIKGKTLNKCLLAAGLTNVFYTLLVMFSIFY